MSDIREPIRMSRAGPLGVVTLDRPEALNALTYAMVRELSVQLREWRDNSEIGAVLIKAVPGRAFCAGGDVVAIAESYRSGDLPAVIAFFRDEYRMNWRIKSFHKPYVAVINGVAMGGGVGVSVHGTHRIVTEQTLFAMPETTIGLAPDIGATFYLPRCPGYIGRYLALTGARLGAADCLYAGIGTHYLPAARLRELEARLVAAPRRKVRTVLDEALVELAAKPEPGDLPGLRARIDACFGQHSLAAVLRALDNEPTGWGKEQLAIIRGKSPLATAVAFEHLKRGGALSFDGCMQLEFRMVQRMLATGEFNEGVRALLIDKDKRPRWRHRAIEDVTQAEIDAVLAPLPDGDLALDWGPT